MGHLLSKLSAFGLAVGFSPLPIALWLPLLQRSKQWLFNKGDLLGALVNLGLAAYPGWQGIEGLQLGLAT